MDARVRGLASAPGGICVWSGIRTPSIPGDAGWRPPEPPWNWLLFPTICQGLGVPPWVRRSNGESGTNFVNFAVGEGGAGGNGRSTTHKAGPQPRPPYHEPAWPPEEGCEAAAGRRVPRSAPAPPPPGPRPCVPEQPEERSAQSGQDGSAPLSASDLLFLYLSRIIAFPPKRFRSPRPPLPSSAHQSISPAFCVFDSGAFIFPFSSTPFFVLFDFSSGPLFSSSVSLSLPPCPLILCLFLPLPASGTVSPLPASIRISRPFFPLSSHPLPVPSAPPWPRPFPRGSASPTATPPHPSWQMNISPYWTLGGQGRVTGSASLAQFLHAY
ncbi:vegetative cell wall protein gp1-like [Pteropus alecto]|uniref:vegetative cell wall protein gp1-like n=1 Tax=Pteropus alecto TaxID=9402 RepID=UPI0007686D73|nr:vegetative cell wall protein gp1-like [Pteropus alecto]XP_015442453.1 vegetative cell wall protein gp1-like [Pteropus alecto]XP_015442455.1 vegetative cell wall protein gp1-like [Pteropus alecto]